MMGQILPFKKITNYINGSMISGHYMMGHRVLGEMGGLLIFANIMEQCGEWEQTRNYTVIAAFPENGGCPRVMKVFSY